jgi:hypothetical protein
MGEQHRYEINLKQGDLFINLSSDDLYFISKQMDKWCQILMDDSYIPISIPTSKPAAQPVQQMAPALPPQAPQPLPQPAPVYEAPPMPVAPPVYAAPPVQPEPVQPVPLPAYAAPPQSVMPQPQAPVEAYPPAAAYQAPPVAPAPSLPEFAQVASSPKPAPKDEFEVVMDSLMKEFEEDAPTVPSAPPARPSLPFTAPPVQEAAPVPGLAGVTTLLELCDRARAESSEDYLILSAYYLTFFEREEKFSLKRINSMLVKSGLTPVNHSVLEATLGRGYLSMVPDVTGLAEVSEYVLTAEGQQAAKQLV